MSRVATWKGLAIAVVLLLAVAGVCIVMGNTDFASALIVLAVIEGTAHAILVTVISARRRRHESQTV
jgi:hypothetical protein